MAPLSRGWKGVSLTLAQLLPGDPARVGRYRLTARLGAGGMGVVYLGAAKDGHPVAVKVLRRNWPRTPSSGPGSAVR